jgi:hypothetical protein
MWHLRFWDHDQERYESVLSPRKEDLDSLIMSSAFQFLMGDWTLEEIPDLWIKEEQALEEDRGSASDS